MRGHRRHALYFGIYSLVMSQQMLSLGPFFLLVLLGTLVGLGLSSVSLLSKSGWVLFEILEKCRSELCVPTFTAAWLVAVSVL